MPQLKKEDYVVAAVVLLISILGIKSFYALRDGVQATLYRQNLLAHLNPNGESQRIEKFFNSVLQVCQKPDGKLIIGGKSSNFTDEAWKEYQLSYVERAKTALSKSRRSCEHDAISVKHGTFKNAVTERPNSLDTSFSGPGEITFSDGVAVSHAGSFWLEIDFHLRSETPDDMEIYRWSFKDSVQEKAR